MSVPPPSSAVGLGVPSHSRYPLDTPLKESMNTRCQYVARQALLRLLEFQTEGEKYILRYKRQYPFDRRDPDDYWNVAKHAFIRFTEMSSDKVYQLMGKYSKPFLKFILESAGVEQAEREKPFSDFIKYFTYSSQEYDYDAFKEGCEKYQGKLKGKKGFVQGALHGMDNTYTLPQQRLWETKDLELFSRVCLQAEPKGRLQAEYKAAQSHMLRLAPSLTLQAWVQEKESIKNGRFLYQEPRFSPVFCTQGNTEAQVHIYPEKLDARGKKRTDEKRVQYPQDKIVEDLKHAKKVVEHADHFIHFFCTSVFSAKSDLQAFLAAEKEFPQGPVKAGLEGQIEKKLSQLPDLKEIQNQLLSLPAIKVSASFTNKVSLLKTSFKDTKGEVVSSEKLRKIIQGYTDLISDVQKCRPDFQQLKKLSQIKKTVADFQQQLPGLEKKINLFFAVKDLISLIPSLRTYDSSDSYKDGKYKDFLGENKDLFFRICKDIKIISELCGLPDSLAVFVEDLDLIQPIFFLRATAYERMGVLMRHYFQDSLPEQWKAQKDIKGITKHSAEECLIRSYCDFTVGKEFSEKFLEFYKQTIEEGQKTIAENEGISASELKNDFFDEIVKYKKQHENFCSDGKVGQIRALEQIKANKKISINGKNFLLDVTKGKDPQLSFAIANFYFQGGFDLTEKQLEVLYTELEKGVKMQPLSPKMRQTLARYQAAYKGFQQAWNLRIRDPDKSLGVDKTFWNMTKKQDCNVYRLMATKAGLFLRSAKLVAQMNQLLTTAKNGKYVKDLIDDYGRPVKASVHIKKQLQKMVLKAINAEEHALLTEMLEYAFCLDLIEQGTLTLKAKEIHEARWKLDASAAQNAQVPNQENVALANRANSWMYYKNFGNEFKVAAQEKFIMESLKKESSNLIDLYSWYAQICASLDQIQEADTARRFANAREDEGCQDKGDFTFDVRALEDLIALDGVHKGEMDLDLIEPEDTETMYGRKGMSTSFYNPYLEG